MDSTAFYTDRTMEINKIRVATGTLLQRYRIFLSLEMDLFQNNRLFTRLAFEESVSKRGTTSYHFGKKKAC